MGGVFKLELFLPEEYPMAAPKLSQILKIYHDIWLMVVYFIFYVTIVSMFMESEQLTSYRHVRFLTKIYHPNVDKVGRLCLDIWKNKWSPALQIRTVLLSIQALLSAPPLSENIAKHWKTNEAEAVETSKEWTRLYASGA